MIDMLKASLYAQLVWFALAALYNVLSLLAIGGGDTGFAGDAATTQSAMLGAMIFAAVTCTGLLGRITVYKILAPIVTIALLAGGVVKHVQLGPADYASQAHWIAAIAINIFGVIAFCGGVIAVYRKV